MSPAAHFLSIPDSADTERLVNNQSVCSFVSETNEVTVTHSISDRRFSKMCIKQKSDNTRDIVITNENTNTPPELSSNVLGSHEIRRQYSKCAKFGVAFVLFMVILMLTVMIIALVTHRKGAIDRAGIASDPILANRSFTDHTSTDGMVTYQP